MRRPGFLTGSLEAKLKMARDYAKLLGGSGGRLVLSLAYFTAVANVLTVSEFGLFATASATGIVLSRVAGLGFVSPLYRSATRKPHLVGTYTAGLLAAFVLSLPLVALGAALFYLGVFAGDMALAPFAAILAAEIVCWRALEVVCIVNNGMNRFGRASVLVVVGTGAKALAALAFAGTVGREGGLAAWSLFYLAANGLAALGGILFLYPRQRLRWRPDLYRRRAADSIAVAGAEVLFYLQSELDKLLVLSLGGPHIAGLYAMLMRLVDLTALPVRSFNMMAVQALMRRPDRLDSWRVRWGVEAGIALVSVGGLAVLGLILHVRPTLLGANVADAAPLVLMALLVPAFRNLVEYEGELLYARGRTGTRAVVLGFLTLTKGALLTLVLRGGETAGDTAWVVGLNGVFAALWLASAMATYTALDTRRMPIARPA
ncbi:lipopolysaccharide biosynthesis protein [uncultured Aureimonas sp.]|uniref:lipopolysaccharide biosynthesis protein n=1 Tax=uncultured Aureimonas sp. TaxID=1604662 RepID=UPI0025DADF4F|nr:lipopolysaccharide biosynthesis protein [uncultured Aureimonas sp.]